MPLIFLFFEPPPYRCKDVKLAKILLLGSKLWLIRIIFVLLPIGVTNSYPQCGFHTESCQKLKWRWLIVYRRMHSALPGTTTSPPHPLGSSTPEPRQWKSSKRTLQFSEVAIKSFFCFVWYYHFDDREEKFSDIFESLPRICTFFHILCFLSYKLGGEREGGGDYGHRMAALDGWSTLCGVSL